MRREARIDAKRALDAASGAGKRFRGASTPSIQADANSLAARIGPRARYAQFNQPLISSAVRVWVSNVVGCGLRPSPNSGSPELDALIMANWEDWTDRADYRGQQSFYGMQKTLAERQFVDGESWLHLKVEGDELRVNIFDPAQIPQLTDMLPAGGGAVIGGVQLDAGGRVIGYRVYESYIPGVPLLRGLQLTFVPAEDLLHYYEVSAAGQTRGISQTSPSLLRSNEFDQLSDAVLMKAKTAAMYCGAITDADGTLMPGDESLGETSLEPGVLMRLKPGKSISFSDPPAIGVEMADFQRAMIREITSGCGIPSFLVDHDMSQVNFSSARVSLLEFRKKIEAAQDHFAFQALRPTYRRWLTLEILSGRIDAPLTEEVLRHRWIAPKAEYLDPLKDANAESVAIAAGLTSRREAVASRGINIEELDNQIASDRAREKALGLDFTPAAAAATRSARQCKCTVSKSFIAKRQTPMCSRGT